MNSGGKEVQHQERGVRDVECRVGNRSDDGDGGVWNAIGGRKSTPRSNYPVERPIHAEHCQKEGRYRVSNEIEALLIKVKEGIEKCPDDRRSTERNVVWSAE
jgi:hypothetical protein